MVGNDWNGWSILRIFLLTLSILKNGGCWCMNWRPAVWYRKLVFCCIIFLIFVSPCWRWVSCHLFWKHIRWELSTKRSRRLDLCGIAGPTSDTDCCYVNRAHISCAFCNRWLFLPPTCFVFDRRVGWCMWFIVLIVTSNEEYSMRSSCHIIESFVFFLPQ